MTANTVSINSRPRVPGLRWACRTDTSDTVFHEITAKLGSILSFCHATSGGKLDFAAVSCREVSCGLPQDKAQPQLVLLHFQRGMS
jgi:hypothetical protein